MIEESGGASPFFVVGCGRSGTSLLRAMLNRHPEIAIPLESLFVVDYLRASPSIPASRLARLLVNDHEFREWGMDISIDDLAGCATPRHLIDRIHALYTRQQGKTRWGQKTPRFIRHGPLLKEAYPEARFIHLIRDPRAVVNSLIRSNLHRSNVYFASKRWVMDVEAGLKLKAAYSSDVLDIKYEDLVSQPETILRQVCSFLGLQYDPRMLAYHDSGTADYTPFFHQAHQNLDRPPLMQGIDRWRSTLSPHQIALIEALCAETMVKVGYWPETIPHPPARLTIAILKAQRLWGLFIQIAHRLLFRFKPLLSFVWRKLQLGVFWKDLREVNY